jgi:drug/metabolite transporter (DMT)-like permease
MIDQLRGRNLAHVGCTIGLVAGLTLGLLLAAALVVLLNSDTGATIATIVLFALTFGLGVLGYILGGRATQRLDADAPATGDEPR